MNRRSFNRILSFALSSLPLIAFTSVGMGSQKNKKPNKISPPKKKPSPTKPSNSTDEWKQYLHKGLGFQCLLPSAPLQTPAGFIITFNQHQILCAANPQRMSHCVFTEPAIAGLLHNKEQGGYTIINYKLIGNNKIIVNSQIAAEGIIQKRVELHILQPGRGYSVRITALNELLDENIVKRVFDSFTILSYVECY